VKRLTRSRLPKHLALRTRRMQSATIEHDESNNVGALEALNQHPTTFSADCPLTRARTLERHQLHKHIDSRAASARRLHSWYKIASSSL
jgi:hypothetical protein